MATRGRDALAMTPLQRPQRLSRNGVIAALKADDDRPGQLRLDDIAPNPENPPARAQDVEDLAASIRQVGVLQALIVAPRAAFLTVYPQHAAAVGERMWVLLGGHRRCAAAMLAGIDEVPVVVRGDLGDRAGETIIHENLHRKALSPIEEARAYQRNLSVQGLSQRKLAEHLGIRQSQISKRLALLTFGPQMQDLVDSGVLSVKDAAEVLDVLRDQPNRDRVEVLLALKIREAIKEDDQYGYSPARWARVAVSEVEHEDQVAAQAQAAAADYGLTLVLRADTTGRDAWCRSQHELQSKRDIAAAARRGDLVAAEAQCGTQPLYYRISAPPSAERDAKDARQRDGREKRARRARARADRARYAVLVAHAGARPTADLYRQLITLSLLTGKALHSNVTHFARKIGQEIGIGPTAEEASDDWAWRTLLPGHRHAESLAFLIALVACEVELRNPSTTVSEDPAVAVYRTWLASHGYTEDPTPAVDDAIEPDEPDAAAGEEG